MTEHQMYRPNWDEYFMLSAIIAATRASCTKFKSGAVITKNKRIIASGYNGNPIGITSCHEQWYCNKDKAGVERHQKGSGHCLATHAEANAIVQNHQQNLEWTTIYCLHFPCNECAKLIISSGIKNVVYLKMYRDQNPKAESMFAQAWVVFRQMDMDFDAALQIIESVMKSAKE